MYAELYMNTPVYLGMPILEITKIVMYKIQYDYVEPQYGEKANFCDMNTDSFIGYMKKEDIYVNVSNDIETKFDT